LPLLFDDEERIPPDDFILQFKAFSDLNKDDIQTIKAVIDGIILRRQASKWINKE